MFSFLNQKKKIKEAAQEAENRIIQALKLREEEKQIESKKIKEFEIQQMLDNLVICVSNEIENIIVGVATGIDYITKENIPQIVVYDLVNKRVVIPLGKVYAYTEQKFNALNNMEANERIAVIYNASCYDIINKEATKIEDPVEPKVWKEKVEFAIKEWKNSKKLGE